MVLAGHPLAAITQNSTGFTPSLLRLEPWKITDGGISTIEPSAQLEEAHLSCQGSRYSGEGLSIVGAPGPSPRWRKTLAHFLPLPLNVSVFTARLALGLVLTLRKFPNNARSDSLTNWWRPVFGKSHGVLVLEGFRENVKVHDMQGRDLNEGERPENVVLQFNPKDGTSMFVPCIWSRWQRGDEILHSMALITSEPPKWRKPVTIDVRSTSRARLRLRG